jgi:hypothetical protein
MTRSTMLTVDTILALQGDVEHAVLDVLVHVHEDARRAVLALNAAAGRDLRAMRARDELEKVVEADPDRQRLGAVYDAASYGIARKRGKARARAEAARDAAFGALVADTDRRRPLLAVSHPDLWREGIEEAEAVARALNEAMTDFEQAHATAERTRHELVVAGIRCPYLHVVREEADRRRALAAT